jgi:hypothetical protein
MMSWRRKVFGAGVLTALTTKSSYAAQLLGRRWGRTVTTMPMVAFFRDHTPFLSDWNRIRAAGAALSINVTTILDSHSAALLLRQQVYDLACAGERPTLTLLDLGAGKKARSRFAEVCRLIRRTLDDANVSSQDVGVVIDAASMPPREAWRIRREQLGIGLLFACLPQRTLPDAFWREAWQLRGNHLVRLVYAPHVVSQTRLLPDERSPGVSGDACLQVPTGTAWVTAEIDLDEFVDEAGIADEIRLGQCLGEVVERGDRVHSSMRWPTAQMRHDAWLNRRLAINLKGAGALMRRRKLDPGTFVALGEMNELLAEVRQTLFSATHRLASRDGIVPALDQADPGRLLPGGRIGEGWAWRWRQALEAAAVRNRNLVAFSPWSIFPHGTADFRYANLLPLLRHADVCCFDEPRDINGWNLHDFKGFHQRAAAVLHQRGAAHQIAVHA